MRRIDLFCKLVSPLAIALIDGFSTKVAILATLAVNAASVPMEYLTIAWTYRSVPLLGVSSQSGREMSGGGPIATPAAELDLPSLLSSQSQLLLRAINVYLSQPAFLPSMSLSLLYLTVLSFSGQMVTYLLSIGYTSTNIGLIRTVSVLVEMSATCLAPKLMAKLGPTRAGMWFLSWQTVCLSIAVGLFWIDKSPFWAPFCLVAGVIASRVGLWGFDLSAQIIIQEEISTEFRGSFSTLESSVQNFFELCSFASTIIFTRPDQFRYPASMSVVAVYTAEAIYATFVKGKRGHLLHKPYCIKGREVYKYEALPLNRIVDPAHASF